MVLIIGGACQGKLKVAFSWLGKGKQRSFYADGAVDSWEAVRQKPIVYRIHEYLKRGLEEGKDMETWANELISLSPEYVIMDEVGYGVVPVIKEQRAFRELVGHTGQLLAREAEAVYRVVCGIPVRIK